MPHSHILSLAEPPLYLFETVLGIPQLGFRITYLFLNLATSGVLEQTWQFIPFITG